MRCVRLAVETITRKAVLAPHRLHVGQKKERILILGAIAGWNRIVVSQLLCGNQSSNASIVLSRLVVFFFSAYDMTSLKYSVLFYLW